MWQLASLNAVSLTVWGTHQTAAVMNSVESWETAAMILMKLAL